jgi:hypothetical protein
MPNAPVSLAVTSDKLSPARNRQLRTMCMARSRSPSWNHCASPNAPSRAIACHVSPAAPQPRASSFRPTTESMSGHTVKPRCSKSSPVFTAIVSCPGGNTAARPAASFAPPTPPESARIWLTETCLPQVAAKRSQRPDHHPATPNARPRAPQQRACLQRPRPLPERRRRPPHPPRR